MIEGLFLVAVLIVAVEVFFIGTVSGFFQKNINKHEIYRFTQLAIIVWSLLILGKLLSVAAAKLAPHYSAWYAATALFVLGFKMFYDGIRLRRLKQFINPLEIKGLWALGIFAGLNAFFVGLSFGLLKVGFEFLYGTIIVFFVAVILGFLKGAKLNKLPKFQFEFISGIIYIVMAIVIANS